MSFKIKICSTYIFDQNWLWKRVWVKKCQQQSNQTLRKKESFFASCFTIFLITLHFFFSFIFLHSLLKHERYSRQITFYKPKKTCTQTISLTAHFFFRRNFLFFFILQKLERKVNQKKQTLNLPLPSEIVFCKPQFSYFLFFPQSHTAISKKILEQKL